MSRIHSTACERNRDPILEVLRDVFPERGLVLEIASGTGMHAAHFAPRLPGLTWQPTDVGEPALASIEAWRAEAGADNLLPPQRLDVLQQPWPVTAADALFNANMIHISPSPVTEGLLRGAAAVLGPDAPMVMYGPFRVGGQFDAPSNAEFDRSLRSRDERWGIRDLEEVQRLAARHGLAFERQIEMPANNLCLVFRRAAAS